MATLLPYIAGSNNHFLTIASDAPRRGTLHANIFQVSPGIFRKILQGGPKRKMMIKNSIFPYFKKILLGIFCLTFFPVFYNLLIIGVL